jgi:hypothetical protein
MTQFMQTNKNPLREDVPDGYQIVDIPLKEEDFKRHNCGCQYCEYTEQEEDTGSLGLVIQEGEAFSKDITWFKLRVSRHTRKYITYHWNEEEGGIEHCGAIGYTHYLGDGCWTRYKEDPEGESPYGEHVVRQLKKIEVK